MIGLTSTTRKRLQAARLYGSRVMSETITPLETGAAAVVIFSVQRWFIGDVVNWIPLLHLII